MEPFAQRRMVLLATVRDIGRQLIPFTKVYVVLTEIARIGQQAFGLAQGIPHLLQSCQSRFDLLLVVGLLREMVLHNQVRIDVHRSLGVVALQVTLRTGHDARFLVGEVDLILVLRTRLRRFGRATAWLLPGLFLFLLAPLQLLFILCLFRLKTLPRALLDLCLGLAYLLKTVFPPRQLFRYIHLRSFFPVRPFRLLEQLLHLPPQLPLQPLRMPPTHGLVLARVRLDLRPVQTHMPQLQ